MEAVALTRPRKTQKRPGCPKRIARSLPSTHPFNTSHMPGTSVNLEEFKDDIRIVPGLLQLHRVYPEQIGHMACGGQIDREGKGTQSGVHISIPSQNPLFNRCFKFRKGGCRIIRLDPDI